MDPLSSHKVEEIPMRENASWHYFSTSRMFRALLFLFSEILGTHLASRLDAEHHHVIYCDLD